MVCKCNWLLAWEGGLRGGTGQDRTGRGGGGMLPFLCAIFFVCMFLFIVARNNWYTLRSTLKAMKNNSPGVSGGPLN